jgi:phage gpG-like protein
MEVDYVFTNTRGKAVTEIDRIQKEVDADVRRILKEFDKSDEPLAEVKKYMDFRLRKAYDDEESMEGVLWDEVKDSTWERKWRGGYGRMGILQRTKRMRNAVWRGEILEGKGFLRRKSGALLYDPSKKLGTKGRRYAAMHVHQKGSKDGKTAARPFIGIADKDKDHINFLFRRWVIKSLKGKQ